MQSRRTAASSSAMKTITPAKIHFSRILFSAVTSRSSWRCPAMHAIRISRRLMNHVQTHSHARMLISFSLSLFPLFLSPTSDNRAHTHARSTLTFSTPLCTLVFAQERPVRRKRNGFSGHITVDVTVRGHFRDERSEGAGEGGGEGGGGGKRGGGGGRRGRTEGE